MPQGIVTKKKLREPLLEDVPGFDGKAAERLTEEAVRILVADPASPVCAYFLTSNPPYKHFDGSGIDIMLLLNVPGIRHFFLGLQVKKTSGRRITRKKDGGVWIGERKKLLRKHYRRYAVPAVSVTGFCWHIVKGKNGAQARALTHFIYSPERLARHLGNMVRRILEGRRVWPPLRTNESYFRKLPNWRSVLTKITAED